MMHAGEGAPSDCDLMFRIVVIGDSAAGKTSLVRRLALDVFDPQHNATIGVDFEVLFREVHGKRVKLQLWDTAGQERFQTITTSYYRSTHAAIIVCDLTSPDALISVRRWLKEFRNVNATCKHVLVLGSKSDMVQNRCITLQQLTELVCDELKLALPPMEITSKNDTVSIERALDALLSDLVKDEQTARRVQRGQCVGFHGGKVARGAIVDLTKSEKKASSDDTLCCSVQ